MMKCYNCQTEMPEGSNFCPNCAAPMQTMQQAPPPPNYYRPIEDTPGMKFILPIGRSGWAIAAGYLGLFSVMLFPAPLAIICSILAIVDMKRNPKKSGWGRAIFGLIMGVLGTVGLLILFVAMAGTSVGRVD